MGAIGAIGAIGDVGLEIVYEIDWDTDESLLFGLIYVACAGSNVFGNWKA